MSPWINWLYHYGVGGLFAISSVVFMVKVGAIDLRRAPDKRFLRGIVGGFVGFVVVHAIWIFWAGG